MTNEKIKKRKTLLTRINLFSIIPNLGGAAIIVFYSIFSLQLPSYIWLPAIKIITVVILLSEFTAGILSHHIMFGRISNMLEDFYDGKLNEKERLNLFKKVSHVPQNHAYLVTGFFLIGSFFLIGIYIWICKIDIITALLSLSESIFCTCLVGAITFTYTRAICTPDLQNIVKSGLPQNEVLKQKTFGQPLLTQTIIFLILPTIVSALLTFYVVWMGYYPLHLPSQWTYEMTQIKRMIYMCILNSSAQIILLIIMNKQIIKSNKIMIRTLEDLEDDLSSDKIIETDIHDEIAYNQYLANLMLNYLKNILKETKEIGRSTDESTNNLLEVAGKTESTAIEQSTATNEIVATMEDANLLSKNIEDKIGEVSDIAVQTADDVSALYSILEKNLEKMAQIKNANEQTIQGIKDVNEKMNNIWEIINLINSIADTTKIIAFNAELEATNVREKGRNFKNVANEIRRLANGTMDSTKEIKNYIDNIQTATDKLSSLSDNSTEQINNGIAIARSLENSFTSINASASESAESSAEIKTKIDQETEAFKQILAMLQQINTGIESFSSSTHLVLDSANDLQITVRELNNINEDTVIEDCHHCKEEHEHENE